MLFESPIIGIEKLLLGRRSDMRWNRSNQIVNRNLFWYELTRNSPNHKYNWNQVLAVISWISCHNSLEIQTIGIKFWWCISWILCHNSLGIQTIVEILSTIFLRLLQLIISITKLKSFKIKNKNMHFVKCNIYFGKTIIIKLEQMSNCN